MTPRIKQNIGFVQEKELQIEHLIVTYGLQQVHEDFHCILPDKLGYTGSFQRCFEPLDRVYHCCSCGKILLGEKRLEESENEASVEAIAILACSSNVRVLRAQMRNLRDENGAAICVLWAQGLDGAFLPEKRALLRLLCSANILLGSRTGEQHQAIQMSSPEAVP